MQAIQYSSILCMQVIQRLQVKQHLLVLMQDTRVTNYNTSQLQATQCIIMYAGYKGYKPKCYRLQGLQATQCIMPTGYKVTSQLQATQYMHTGYRGYTSQLQATTQCIMHTGYRGYKPIASNNTMYYACRLQGLQANCKQYNMWPHFGKLTKLSHLAFQEIPISNIEIAVIFCARLIVTTVDILYNWNNLITSVL